VRITQSCWIHLTVKTEISRSISESTVGSEREVFLEGKTQLEYMFRVVGRSEDVSKTRLSGGYTERLKKAQRSRGLFRIGSQERTDESAGGRGKTGRISGNGVEHARWGFKRRSQMAEGPILGARRCRSKVRSQSQ